MAELEYSEPWLDEDALPGDRIPMLSCRYCDCCWPTGGEEDHAGDCLVPDILRLEKERDFAQQNFEDAKRIRERVEFELDRARRDHERAAAEIAAVLDERDDAALEGARLRQRNDVMSQAIQPAWMLLQRLVDWNAAMATSKPQHDALVIVEICVDARPVLAKLADLNERRA